MLIRGATLPDGRRRDVLIEGQRVSAVGEDLAGEPVVEADGLRLLPGAIDVHVHFREPGAPHKETWETGSQAAAAGGVTTVVDQPNTDPPTVDAGAVQRKLATAQGTSIVDFAVNGGVTPTWRPDELFEAPIAALGEVFMADSTGELGIGPELFESALREAARRDALVTVHAEDPTRFDDAVRGRTDAAAWSDYRPVDAEVAATERALAVAASTGARLHLAHASTPEAVDRVAAAGGTCEATPHHLLLSRDDLEELGTLGRMNPPLRDDRRRRALLERLVDGTVDMVASDHAPHTLAEKDADIWRAPSGVPGVETMVPVLLGHAADGDLPVERVAEATARAPADRFGFARKGRIAPGVDADLALYDLERVRPVDAERLATACGWTPFEGRPAVFPVLTLLRGRPAYVDPDEPPPGLSDGLAGSAFGPPRGRNVVAAQSSV
ncbi:MAG: dihydroorotase [Halobacteriota archaeon]